MTPEELGLDAAALERIDAYVQAQIDAGLIPGAVTLVARHGHVCHVGALGMKDVAAGEPAQADGLYRIFSMTKPVTAAAMMILWDEGRWTLDDPIARHLPAFADVRVVAGREADGTPRLEPPQRAPTMRDLVTHSAGLAYGTRLGDPNDPVDAAYRAAGVWEAPSLGEMMDRLATCPLAYHPGSSWRYSIGRDVQGALIERWTGQSLAAFMRERLFAPLGMEDTAFFTPPAKAARLATLYARLGDAPMFPVANPMFEDAAEEPARALGGAGLVSTAYDYARFGQMLLDRGDGPGGRLLSVEAVRVMMTNHLSDALVQRGFVAGHQRIRPGFGIGVNGVVFTDPAAAGVPVGRGTYHWDGAAGTWFWVDPENDLLFVGMTQCLSYTAPPLQETTQRMMAEAIVR